MTGQVLEHPESATPEPPTERDDIALHVEHLAGYGVSLGDIALVVGIDRDEVEARFADRLEIGPARARAKVAEAAYALATSGKNFQATAAWLREHGTWRGAADDDEAAPDINSLRLHTTGDVLSLAVVRQTRKR